MNSFEPQYSFLENCQHTPFAAINGKNIYVVFNQVSVFIKYGLTKLKKRVKKVKYVKCINHIILKNDEIIEAKDGYFMNQFTANKLQAHIEQEAKLRNRLAEQVMEAQSIDIEEASCASTYTLDSFMNYKPEFWPLERESKFPLTEMFYTGTNLINPCVAGIKITT